MCGTPRLIQKHVGEIQSDGKKVGYASAPRKKVGRRLCLSFTMAHLFRGRGQPLLGNHVAFRSWHAYLHACLFGVALARRLAGASNVARARVTTRGLAFFGSGRFFKFSSESRAAAWTGGVSAAAISTYTCHPQSERSFGNVMSVWGTQMAWDAATYMIKEFWPDLHKKRKSSH
jgi:hypothetical protein